MAKSLPSAQDLGVVTTQPSLAVASYKGATGGEDDAARGLIHAGQQFGKVAEHLNAAQERFDALQAEDRLNQYQERLNQIALDPNTGWSTAKGENAIKADFGTRYAKQFEDERQQLMGTLETPNARQRFAQLSAAAAMRSRAALYEHSAKERMAYEGKVASDTLKGIKDNIWRSFGDDAKFAAEVERAKAVIGTYTQGWGAGASAETRAAALQETESNLWRHRIEAAAAAGETKLAREYMGKATGSLTTTDKAEIDAKIKPQIKITEAQNYVEEVFKKLVPADPNAPFPALALDEALRKKFADDPESLRMARAEADYRRGRVEIEQKESNNNNIGIVMEAFHVKNRSMADVMKMPEFMALQGDAKSRVALQMESTLAQRESRAFTREGRALQALNRQQLELKLKGMETYLRLRMDPEAVAAMKPDELKGIAAQIGWEHTQDLVGYHAQLQKPKGLAGAKLGMDAFKGIYIDYLTEDEKELLSKPAKSDSNRVAKLELQGRLSGALLRVNQEIEQRSVKGGKALTKEEAEDTARSVMSQTIRLKGTFAFGFGKPEEERRAALMPRELKPEDQARVYVPIQQIPAEEQASAAQFIRSYRENLKSLPLDQRFINDNRNLIERLVGLKQSGATQERLIEFVKTGR